MSDLKLSVVLPWVLLSLSAAMIFRITQTQRDLREEFLEHRQADGRLSVGSFVPAMSAATVSGDTVVVGAQGTGERQVLFLLTSTCEFCRQTLPSWKHIDARLKESPSSQIKVQVIGLTSDSTATAAAYASSNELAFPLIPFPHVRYTSLYRGFIVPQTVILDHDGRVLFARRGVINTQAAIDSIVDTALKPSVRRAARVGNSG